MSRLIDLMMQGLPYSVAKAQRDAEAALPSVQSEPMLACSEAMLQAAISRAVENGLLPKCGFPDQTAADWTRMRECVEAALRANRLSS